MAEEFGRRAADALGGYWTRAEQDAYGRMIEAENDRQNKRIGELENTVKQIHQLTISVSELATSMKSVSEDVKQVKEQVTAIEKKPLDNLEQFRMSILTGIGGLIAGGIVTAIMWLITNTAH